MTHELKAIIEVGVEWQQQGHSIVLATVVQLDGSSYRRPGVRMLWNEQGDSVGAVSGGCVEKEVFRQAQSVFETGEAKIMTYDGRYRLGCEGILYILLEKIIISEACITAYQKHLKTRTSFVTSTYYYNTPQTISNKMGTVLQLDDQVFSLNDNFLEEESSSLLVFEQTFSPLFRLFIFGAEHDAAQLSRMAAQLGWEVHIIAAPDEQKSKKYFKGAASLQTPLFSEIDATLFDEQTAVVLMTHSLNKDLQYLLALRHSKPAYLGLLGPAHRRERMLSELMELHPDIDTAFIDRIHGPAGINIGAESASEIALSILSEILSVIREQEPRPLQDKIGAIHE